MVLCPLDPLWVLYYAVLGKVCYRKQLGGDWYAESPGES